MKNMLKYKKYPLVRCNNQIYYGNMTDKFIVFIQIINSENIDNIEIGTKIFVQLLSTDTNLSPDKRIVKQTDKNNLLNALEISNVWLLKSNV